MSFWGQGAQKRTRQRKLRNRARVYTDVNQHRPREYWNYEALMIQWGYVIFLAICRHGGAEERNPFFLVSLYPTSDVSPCASTTLSQYSNIAIETYDVLLIFRVSDSL